MRPVLIEVDLVRMQDPPRLGLVSDKGAVQEFASASPIQRSRNPRLRSCLSHHPVSRRTAHGRIRQWLAIHGKWWVSFAKEHVKNAFRIDTRFDRETI